MKGEAIKRDTIKTKVIFRKIEGEVTAIFPETEKAGVHCNMCYAIIGQHGACDLEWIKAGKIPTITECIPLINELQGLGYNLLFADK